MSIKQKKVALSRKLGMNVVGTHRDPLARRKHPPGQHGTNMRRRKSSDYKVRLVEKQRLRAIYNLKERKFASYVRESKNKKGSSEQILMQLLESRLDTVALKSGFARTQREARQLVVHGHFYVNGRKADKPSFACRPGDVISLKPGSMKKTFFKEKVSEVIGRGSPRWIIVNQDKWTAKYERYPEVNEIPITEELNLGYIMEYYA